MISKRRILVSLGGTACALAAAGILPNVDRLWSRLPATSADPSGAQIATDLANRIETTPLKLSAKRVLTIPSEVGCHYVRYDLRRGEIILNPTESLYFAIPEHLRNEPLIFGYIGHRQLDQHPMVGERDEYPGYTSFQAYNAALNSWRFPSNEWSSGPNGAKFSEARGTPEMDAIFDIGRHGHLPLEADDVVASSDKSPLKAEAVRVVNQVDAPRKNGRYVRDAQGHLRYGSPDHQDPVYIGDLILKTYPGEGNAKDEAVFGSPKEELYQSSFGRDSFSMAGYRYGGGTDGKHLGHYCGALKVNGRANTAVADDTRQCKKKRAKQVELPAGWTTRPGEIIVPAQEGAELLEVEVMAGDSREDEVLNSDKGYGSHGGARLSILLRHRDGREELMMNEENLGPTGTYRAAPMGNPPANCKTIALPGDQVVVRVTRDTGYIMGIRVRYQK